MDDIAWTVESLYSHLKQVARGQRRKGGWAREIQTTELVHELYLKIEKGSVQRWRSREHFLAFSATAMRHILVDFAKERARKKRGGDLKRVTLNSQHQDLHDWGRMVEVHDVLDQLRSIDPRKVAVVECRYFAGYSEEETATVLGLSKRSVQRLWAESKRWLRRTLEADQSE